MSDEIEHKVALTIYRKLGKTKRRPEGQWNDEVTAFFPTERERMFQGESFWPNMKPGQTGSHIWALVERGLAGQIVPADIYNVCAQAPKIRERLLLEHVDKIASRERTAMRTEQKRAAQQEQRAYKKSTDYKRAKAYELVQLCERVRKRHEKKAKFYTTKLKRWTAKERAARRALARLDE